jgi:hypothetical protein
MILLHAISARMASIEAAHRVHSAGIHQIVASTGPGGISSTIIRSSSTQRCFAVDSYWRHLSVANAGAADAVVSRVRTATSLPLANAVAGNAKSANITKSIVAPWPAPFLPMLHSNLLPPGNNAH